MRKQHLLCSVAAIAIITALSGPVAAADIPVKARPAPAPALYAPNWTGFYIGGHLGYGEGKFPTIQDIDDLSRIGTVNKPSGIVGGMHGGYNWQMNAFVFGLEGDLSATGWRKSTFFGTSYSSPFRQRRIDNSVNLLASLRGRLGLAFDRTLLYVTGGLAYTQGTFLAISPFSGTVAGEGKFKKWGSVFGGGVEWKQNPNFSWRAEGLWYRFNTEKNFNPTGDHTWSHKFKDAWVVRGGMSYHFDGGLWGKGPVAARY